MGQPYLLPLEPQNDELSLPPLEVGPISHAIGQIRWNLRPAEKVEVREITEIQISPRIKEPLYHLANGERLVVTARRNIARPAGATGVLQSQGDGTFRWLSHSWIEDVLADAARRGWPAVAAHAASSWENKFHFTAERPNADGVVVPGREGLRPPQLGALHAIGAHWSLSHAPATIVMPTGTGKTETMLATLAAFGRQPLLVVVPWDLLRGQTARKFLTFGLLRLLKVLAPEALSPVVGVVTKRPETVADLDMFESCNVIIATASSLSGDALALAPEIASRCAALIVDEAHHVVAPTWAEFRAAFKDRPVLQFTATPFRRDNRVLDGQVIYNYPLRSAQRDGYFKRISFEPVYEIDQQRADRAIADVALARLRADLADGRNHLMMARCVSIDRARLVYEIYRELAADLNPLLIHSEVGDTDARLQTLRTGQSRIAVCVNMLGEGIDVPELKVAAVHDMHRSLAILLQFTGRFTRTAAENIGDATVVANIADPDVSGALERLYSQDADWNELLSELSSEAAREHAELVAFLNESRRLDGGDADDDEEISISHQLLRPSLSTLTYRAGEFHPERFHTALSEHQKVRAVWLNRTSNTLYFVTRVEPPLRWTRSQEMRDREWGLFILHFDQQRQLLFLSSTDHSSTFKTLAEAVCGDVELISGDTIFRVLGHINRLIFQSVGVKKHGRRNLSYANYTGADVATALGLAERAGSVKNNLAGTGWEDGKRIGIGCSYKGRVWSREMGTIPQFVKWTARIGDKLLDDTIDTREILAHVLIPTEVNELPDKEVLAIEWPVELLQQSEERVTFRFGEGEELPMFLFELRYVGLDRAENSITFELLTGEEGEVRATFTFFVGGPGGFRVEQSGGDHAFIKAGTKRDRLDNYLSDYPPLFRFVDLDELDANMLVHPQDPQQLSIPDGQFEVWDWTGVDRTKESMWKGGQERQDSIQWRAARHYIDGGFDVVFDDDSAGEAADLVCLKEEDDHIRLALVHCKFAGGASAGERVKDVVEVCSQAIRSAKWKGRFRDLIRHLLGRESRLGAPQRPSRFLTGAPADLNRFIKISRFKEIRAEILIVQPGLSESGRTNDQNMVLAAAFTYLKETIGADMDVICDA